MESKLPKPDPWACRLHPEGRCGAIYTEEKKIGCAGLDGVLAQWYADTCPWSKTRQKPAPARRTKFEVAKDAYLSYRNERGEGFGVSHAALKAALVEIGVNPDEMEG